MKTIITFALIFIPQILMAGEKISPENKVNEFLSAGKQALYTVYGLPVLDILLLIAFVIVIFVVRNAKKYAESYVDNKAQNLATKEDIEEITRLTKTVEEEIKRGSLIEQKRWDSKKDIYYDLLQKLNELRSVTGFVMEIYNPETEADFIERNKVLYDSKKARQLELITEIGQISSVALLFVGQEADASLKGLIGAFRVASDILDEDPYTYHKTFSGIADVAYKLILKAAKKDLYSE